MTRRLWLHVLVAATASIVVVAGCTDAKPIAKGPSLVVGDSGARVEFVTLGSSETSGDRVRDSLQTSWPQLVYRMDLPQRAIYVNLSNDRSTVADGLTDQLPAALAIHPTIATVWFGTSDAFAATPIDRYASEFDHLVRGLQASGAKVLVILDPAPLPGRVNVAAYNAQARAIAAKDKAVLVDLTISQADFSTPVGQQAIADAISKALGPIR